MSLTRFTVRQIEAFVAVAEARGISAAAGRLGLTAQAAERAAADIRNRATGLVRSPAHPLAARPALVWRDLPGHALVSAGRDHERSVVQMMLTQPEDTRVMPVEIVDNVTTALGAAAQGLAATLAPAYVSAIAASMGLVMRRVCEPETIRKVCLYRRANRPLSPAAEGVAEHLAAWLPGWADGLPSVPPG
ncbi:MAG: LysR family transcriptional regulator [Burkholderiales bacterium]|nr:LysR family transcriptional regulator [Burkholderiales bacterium]